MDSGATVGFTPGDCRRNINRPDTRGSAMRPVHLSFLSALGCCALAACGSAPTDHRTGATSEPLLGDGSGPFLNQAGFSANLSTAGFIDRRNEFFQSLGTNGRACATCHTAKDGFSITPKTAQELFDRCELEAPLLASSLDFPALADERIACAIFRTNDGSNSPNADVSTRDARRAAYSLLLSKGLIRIGIGVPENADFDVVAIDDPYGYATPQELSLFRRPLPATDLVFDRSVMWDIRETSTTFIPAPFVVKKTLNDQLKTQANNATLRHAQAVASLTDAQLQSIVNFELGLFSAQVFDFGAGFLGSGGATGGVVNLSTEPVPANASNVFGLTAFTPIVFTLFDAWAQQQTDDFGAAKRASIERGQVLFNTRRAPGINRPPFFDPTGTNCSECHNSANNGGSTVPVPTGQVRVSAGQFRTPDLPLYTLQCSASGVAKKACTAGQQDQTTDPGRALITGSWRSLDNFKVPGLRNLAARAPYFHNGSAATLGDVVDFYKTSMGFQFTDDEKQDLVNFMSAL
jgi:cytochrome c peroxidase